MKKIPLVAVCTLFVACVVAWFYGMGVFKTESNQSVTDAVTLSADKNTLSDEQWLWTVNALKSPNYLVRIDGLQVLGRIKTHKDESLTYAKALRNDENEVVRAGAIIAICNLTQKTAAAFEALRDKSEYVQQTARTILAKRVKL